MFVVVRFAVVAVVAFVGATVLAGCRSVPQPADPAADPARNAQAQAEAEVDSIIARVMKERSIPGISVVVTRGGHTLVAKGYGLSNRERGIAATADTVYRLGSLSKQFTATAVMTLVEDSKLGLDDVVADKLPSFPAAPEPVRVHHLLRQVSGLPEFFAIPGFEQMITTSPDTVSRDDLVELIRSAPFSFSPGSRWSYSNSNYTFLGLPVEALSGEPLHAYIERRLVRPLGLGNTHGCSNNGTGEAIGYVMRGGALAVAHLENMNTAIGDGGMCSSANDLAAWWHALVSGRVISRDSYVRMTTIEKLPSGDTPPYGFGLSLLDLDGRRKVAHGGAIDGTASTLAYYPDDDLLIVLMANRGGIWPQEPEQAIARALLQLPPPTFVDLVLSPAERERYVGTYYLGVFDLHVVEREGGLRIEMPWPAPSTDLRYQGDGRFVSAEDPDVVQLELSADVPHATRALLVFAGMRWYGERVKR